MNKIFYCLFCLFLSITAYSETKEAFVYPSLVYKYNTEDWNNTTIPYYKKTNQYSGSYYKNTFLKYLENNNINFNLYNLENIVNRTYTLNNFLNLKNKTENANVELEIFNISKDVYKRNYTKSLSNSKENTLQYKNYTIYKNKFESENSHYNYYYTNGFVKSINDEIKRIDYTILIKNNDYYFKLIVSFINDSLNNEKRLYSILDNISFKEIDALDKQAQLPLNDINYNNLYSKLKTDLYQNVVSALYLNENNIPYYQQIQTRNFSKDIKDYLEEKESKVIGNSIESEINRITNFIKANENLKNIDLYLDSIDILYAQKETVNYDDYFEKFKSKDDINLDSISYTEITTYIKKHLNELIEDAFKETIYELEISKKQLEKFLGLLKEMNEKGDYFKDNPEEFAALIEKFDNIYDFEDEVAVPTTNYSPLLLDDDIIIYYRGILSANVNQLTYTKLDSINRYITKEFSNIGAILNIEQNPISFLLNNKLPFDLLIQYENNFENPLKNTEIYLYNYVYDSIIKDKNLTILISKLISDSDKNLYMRDELSYMLEMFNQKNTAFNKWYAFQLYNNDANNYSDSILVVNFKVDENLNVTNNHYYVKSKSVSSINESPNHNYLYINGGKNVYGVSEYSDEVYDQLDYHSSEYAYYNEYDEEGGSLNLNKLEEIVLINNNNTEQTIRINYPTDLVAKYGVIYFNCAYVQTGCGEDAKYMFLRGNKFNNKPPVQSDNYIAVSNKVDNQRQIVKSLDSAQTAFKATEFEKYYNIVKNKKYNNYTDFINDVDRYDSIIDEDITAKFSDKIDQEESKLQKLKKLEESLYTPITYSNEEKLYFSGILFSDLDSDGIDEAFIIAANNGKIVYDKLYTIVNNTLVAYNNPKKEIQLKNNTIVNEFLKNSKTSDKN